MTNKSAICFAHDPGTRHYGFSQVRGEISKRSIRFQILRFGLIKTTINNLKGRAYQEQRTQYEDAVTHLSSRYPPSLVIAERYQPRGVNQMVTGECVNIMLGVLTTNHRDIHQRLIPASQWKNALRRIDVDLDAIYLDQKTDEPAYRLTNHEIDACFIGVFGLNMLAGFKGFDGTPNVAKTVIQSMRNAERINMT
jgi:hypothetical protein